MALVHREPYITLAGLTETSALIAWGAFFFDVTGQELDGRFKIIEDRDLKFLNPPRKTSIDRLGHKGWQAGVASEQGNLLKRVQDLPRRQRGDA